jgi:hypothetical protein
VAILNRGELVTRGPIETLLAGGDGSAYQPGVKGSDLGRTRSTLQALPWVRGIQDLPGRSEVARLAGEHNWLVPVADDAAAEIMLLRTVLAVPGVNVTHFRRREYELEEIFVQIIEGGQHGRQ